jgi:hypothetical protein
MLMLILILRIEPSHTDSAICWQNFREEEVSRPPISFSLALTSLPVPTRFAPSGSRDLGREADVVIRPEEQNCNNQTKVSTDTFV